jgi:broad specificity phosphatase PhoE
MPTTRVYLIRHGATPLTAEDRFSGDIGVELSDEGRAQVDQLAVRLQGDGIAAIYCSPMSRAIETATIIGGRCGIEPQPRGGLQEIGHGRWEGMTRRDVERQFASEYAQWSEDPFTFAPEGGESGVAVLARALPALRDIVVRHAGARVAVVSHKATIRLMLSSLLGFDARGYRDRLDQAPACLNIVDFRDPVHARLMLFNDTSHYAGQTRVASHSLSRWWDRTDSVG